MIIALTLALCVLEYAAFRLAASLGYVAMAEFPAISTTLIEKFANFDSALGHLPRPGSFTFDRDITGKAYSTKCSYNSDGARSSAYAADAPAAVSTFGDSFCQCRGVNDDETWQRYLERSLGCPVRNYGVGGHGIDQAFLRYLSMRQKPLGSFIIFAVSACTIERIVGIYKHYIEFGNVLGLKPRFRLDPDGDLELLSLPISQVDELSRLSIHREWLHAVDHNYEGFFRKHAAHFPYIVYLLRHPYDCLNAISRLLMAASERVGILRETARRMCERYGAHSRQAAYDRKNRYFKKLFRQHHALFVRLIHEIVKEVEADQRIPVLLMMPDHTNISFMKKDGHYYRSLLDEVANRFGILVLDSFDLLQTSAPHGLFLKDNFSGHHTAAGNRRVAEYIQSALNGHHHLPTCIDRTNLRFESGNPR